ncbi:DegV family protein [Streptococcus porcinus]|uniref:DegV family protein n=2 Tax=Streptococcus porcinus TaxID=1340 RepID=A0A4V6LXV9_STRPO|nr:DegV family protein [Streptococcus porcinus]EGJ27472.1 EDD domain protein, DegV family [Streptococcus porcinus str. Jelinkova 176]MBA2796158.1 DegV family protein [Streptococcus porcinus]SQG42840.1 fatty acid-binding protein, DegV family [Streptococcus porcinus]VTT41849.1 fatty acid-binding protein, DegV family [Streptococcus porcinus]VTT43110.1 fatty acid-binding protein, DegV family [Streptococcus porcinus]
MSFFLLTDSTADLDPQWAEEHQVEVVGLSIECEGKIYSTVGSEALTSQDLLAMMKAGSKPTTSQINVGTFEEIFRRHAKNQDDLLYIAFSSVLSGTYQSALIAREMVLEEYPDAVIEIVDTLAAAGGEGYLSILAAEARDKGRSLQETKVMIEDILPRLRTYFLVDDLYHLMRGGRLSKSSAIIGSLASIKPILWINRAGSLVPIAKVRGRKKAINEIMNQVVGDIAHSTVIIGYSDDLESAQKLRDALLENPQISDVLIMPIGPVIAAHVGPNTLAAFAIGKEVR